MTSTAARRVLQYGLLFHVQRCATGLRSAREARTGAFRTHEKLLGLPDGDYFALFISPHMILSLSDGVTAAEGKRISSTDA